MNGYEYQRGLNEVTERKVRRMIDNRAATVKNTIGRMIYESERAQDFTAAIGKVQHENGSCPDIYFNQRGNRLLLQTRDQEFLLHNHAVGQLADKIGVPAKYLRELSQGPQWQQELAVTILNKHTDWNNRSRLLIRAVGDEVRGILSVNYRRLHSVQILTAFLQEAEKQNAAVCDALMTDTRIYVETILPTPVCIPTVKNGDVAIYIGARFSTSDYGDGSLDIRTFFMNGVCLNGMVSERVMREIHLGGRLPENILFSDETYRKDTEAVKSMVRDLTGNLYSPQNINLIAEKIQCASGIDADFDAELGKLVKVGKLQKPESEGIRKLLMNNDPADGLAGESTLWKLTQAITAHGREMEEARKRELHELSGELMARAFAKA